MQNKVRPIAIHLPQFHPFPENDEWWGKGFTEWTNVTSAKPLFPGHYQPHLPADLGFYDLRLEESRIAQAELAKEYGIYGFCHYHYWFNGKRLMNRPLDDMLETQTPDFPFMLCWANENWTRRWDGKEEEVLIHQNYSEEDDLAHIKFLCETFFSDQRYIKIEGKPFISIYKPYLLPDLKKTLECWRREAVKAGFPGMVIAIMNQTGDFTDTTEAGFDYAIDFQPNFDIMPTQEFAPFRDKLKSRLGIGSPYYDHKIVSYKKYVEKIISSNYFHPKLIPGITPGWDNTARKRKKGFIFKDANPEDYGKWLKYIIDSPHGDQPFVFINAWNEWAEGNHLEPDTKWGRKFLEETKRRLDFK